MRKFFLNGKLIFHKLQLTLIVLYDIRRNRPDFRSTMSIWELVNKAKNLTFVNAVRGATDTAILQVRKVCEN